MVACRFNGNEVYYEQFTDDFLLTNNKIERQLVHVNGQTYLNCLFLSIYHLTKDNYIILFCIISTALFPIDY